MNKLFNIISTTAVSEDHFVFNLLLDKDHEIFKGHFPGNPILPGVCMIEIIKQMTEAIVKKELQMLNADNIKFVSVLNPCENSDVSVDVIYKNNDDGSILVKSNIYKDQNVFVKFKGVFK